MKTKKRISIYLLISIIFIILYFIFAARPLSSEYNFIPEWKINTLNPKITKTDASTQKMSFLLGQTSGYFTENGEITLFNTFPSKISISDKYYSLYTSDAKNLSFYTNNGEKKGILNISGFPYFDDDNIFVFLPGGNSFSKCNENGEAEWTIERTVPITAFDSNSSYCAVGYADGNIKVLQNKTGTCILDYFPGASDIPVIYGLSISNDGKYTASISGQNKTRFVVAENVNNQPKIIFHSFFDEKNTTRTIVHFSKDANTVYYNYSDILGIYDIQSNNETKIKIDKKIISVEESELFTFFLGRNTNEFTVYCLEHTNSLQGKFTFKAQNAFIKTNKENLYIGKDNTISKIRIVKE